MSIHSVLITGGSGSVGSVLIPLLCSNGIVVYSIERSKNNSFEHKNYFPIVFDLVSQSPSLLDNISYDSIIYMAQSRGYREFPDQASDVLSINTAVPLGLLQYSLTRGLKKFIYLSTGSIFAPSDHPLTEVSAKKSIEDCDFYSASKLSAEYLLSQYKHYLDIVVLRPFFIYGPSSVRTMLLPRLFDSVKTSIPVTISGQNGLIFNPIHSVDVSIAILKSLALRGSDCFNLAGNDQISIKQICDYFASYLAVSPVYNFLDGADSFCVSDISKICSFLHTPSKSIFDNIDDLSLA